MSNRLCTSELISVGADERMITQMQHNEIETKGKGVVLRLSKTKRSGAFLGSLAAFGARLLIHASKSTRRKIPKRNRKCLTTWIYIRLKRLDST